MDLLETLGRFQLDLLPDDWVMDIWNNQFADPSELPIEYELFLENIPMRQLLNETCASIKQWLASSDMTSVASNDSTFPSRLSDASLFKSSSISTSSKSWQTLINNNFKHKNILCLLSTFIHQGKTDVSDENKRQIGLGATNLYFILLAIPGSKVYKIFNPLLYAHAVDSLKSCTLLDSVANKPSKRNARNDDSDDSDDSEHPTVITGSGKITLMKSLNILLNDMLYLLQRFHLKDETDSLVLTIQILVLMTRLEKRVSNFLVFSPSQPSTTSLAHNAYIVLKNICDPEHGDVQETVRLIMQELLPSILIIDQRVSLMTPKEALVIKDHSILFIKRLLMSIKEPAFLGTEALVQHLCVRLPDRAEARAKGVQVVFEVINVLPYSLYSKIIVWIMQLCHNDEVKNRITGLELVLKLLSSDERANESCELQISYGEMNNESAFERYSKFSTHKFLLATIFSRCKDVSATVRAKALSIIATLISANNTGIKHEIESLFLVQVEDMETQDNEGFKKGFFNLHKFLLYFDIEKAREFDPLPGTEAVFELLESFVEDPKVFVRKSALHVLANIFLINENCITKQRLQVMEMKCRDISVSVRKMLIQCLTELLEKYPSHQNLPLYWVRGVMPLLSDQEMKSQEKVLEALNTLLLNNFELYTKMRTPHHTLPWKLLDLIGELKMRKQLIYACHKWSQDKVLKQRTIDLVISHIETPNNNAAWFFLSAVSECMGLRNIDFAISYFRNHILKAAEIDEYCSQLVMEVLYLNWRQLSEIDQAELCSQLLEELNLFSVSLTLIARFIDLCHVLTNHLSENKEVARERVVDWAGKLVKRSQKYLKKTIGPKANEVVENEDLLAQHIFTLGDALQISPTKDISFSLKLLQNLLNHEIAEENRSGEENQWQGVVGASVRAVAVVTLGKMSLQNEKTAKSLIPLFGILLSTSRDCQLKINTMVALTDLCMKYTSVVEKLLPDMCMCLRDKQLSVRENTLTLLIHLIQEDYLKLRCPLFFYILCMRLDENPSMRDMVSVFIENSVLPKQKNIMVQHFVESLFFYNAYTDHPAYSKVVNFKEHEAFSLAGNDKSEQRRQIYRYMLELMMDDHRFRVTYSICGDILAGVVEETILLNEKGTAVLKDALYVLSSDEIRLSHLRPGGKEDDDDGEGNAEINVAQVITNMAKKTLISQVVRKNVIENMVPIIIQLKHKLKLLKSPLVKDLMEYLRELMKDYKDEINDILAADKELAAEVLLDLQTSEEQASGEESGDELSKVVNGDDGSIRQLIMNAVVRVEQLSASILAKHLNGGNKGDGNISNIQMECSPVLEGISGNQQGAGRVQEEQQQLVPDVPSPESEDMSDDK